MKSIPAKRKVDTASSTARAPKRRSALPQAARRKADRVVQLLAEYESKPKGSEERFQAFRSVLKAVHDEPHG
jgi:hypothetical protein